jgi:hypothetical protein
MRFHEINQKAGEIAQTLERILNCVVVLVFIVGASIFLERLQRPDFNQPYSSQICSKASLE